MCGLRGVGSRDTNSQFAHRSDPRSADEPPHGGPGRLVRCLYFLRSRACGAAAPLQVKQADAPSLLIRR